jgi:hypothetical protein
VNSLFAQDVMSFSLHYQDQDYEPIGGDQPVSSVTSATALGAQRNNLWNGNIGAMVTSLQAPVGSDYTAGAKLIQGMAYKYDQLNRLKTAVGYNTTAAATYRQRNPFDGQTVVRSVTLIASPTMRMVIF